MMVTIGGVATYQPSWASPSGRRVLGPDEDVATLAVAAGRAALDVAGKVPDGIRSVRLITLRPDYLEGNTREVVGLALGLSTSVPVELLIGGGPTTLETVASAWPGTLVIAVDPTEPAGSAAVVVTDGSGSELSPASRVARSIPISVRRAGDPEGHVYDDSRFLRERGWAPAVTTLLEEAPGPGAVTGLPVKLATRFGGDGHFSTVDVEEAAAPLFALANLLESATVGRVVAVLEGTAMAVDVTSCDSSVTRVRRQAVGAPPNWDPQVAGELPIALPAYERAFEAKVGLIAAECTECGTLSYPERTLCLSCGSLDATRPHPLPSSGSVYSVVTVHAPVPGKVTPYSLAIVSLDDVDVRVLVHVADVAAGQTTIGDRGTLVLRRVAERMGIADYGYAFQPQEVPA